MSLQALGEEQEEEEDDHLSGAEEDLSPSFPATPSLAPARSSIGDDDSESTPPSATPQSLLACSNLYHDAANRWLVCMECRIILSPRTAAHHVSQVHQRHVKGLHSAIMSLELQPVTQREPKEVAAAPRHLPEKATWNCCGCPAAFLSRAQAFAHLQAEHSGNGTVAPGRGVMISQSPRKLVKIANGAPIDPLASWPIDALASWLTRIESQYQEALQIATSGPSDPPNFGTCEPEDQFYEDMRGPRIMRISFADLAA